MRTSFLVTHRGSSRSAFTLIELLVVIAIIAILAVVVVLTLNPAQLLAQSRDATRLSDLATLTSALNLYAEDTGGNASFTLGSAGTIYISVPDPNATTTAGDQCQGLGMSSSTTYHCAASSSYRNVNAAGWIPVDFTQISSGAPFGVLPKDPINQTSSGLYYSYATNGTTFEVSANPESQKYTAQEASNTTMFVAGSNTSLLTVGSLTSGSISESNMRLSLASNTAFVDFSSAGSLTPYIGDKLTIKDSAGNTLVGYIKAAGTGETYGSELLPNTAFNDTSGVWWYGTGVTEISVAGGHTGNGLELIQSSSYAGGAGEDWTATVGGLYRYILWMEDGGFGSDGSVGESGGSYTNYAIWGDSATTWTESISYGTALYTSSRASWESDAANGNALYLDDMSMKQVLTPSTTGVTIVSSGGGSTYNWTSEGGGFNTRDTSGYTYTITTI